MNALRRSPTLRSTAIGGCSGDGAPRGAFTLLELIIALGLTVLLLTAIYGAVSIYMRISIDDNAQLERSRLARSLFRQMALDIQSVVFRASEEGTTEESGAADASGSSSTSAGGFSFSSGSTSASGSFSTESTSSSSGATEDAATGTTASPITTVGLFGDQYKLTVHISRPSRDMAYQSLQSGLLNARTSDLQSVTYFLADPNAGGLEGAVAANALQGQSASLQSRQVQGLARLAGDELAVNLADLESDVETLATSAKILAPEVVSLQFEYFDGISWQTSWDSPTLGRLPNAVAITLGFTRVLTAEEEVAQAPSMFAKSSGAPEATGAVVEYRRQVVSLPLADPSTGEL